MVEESHQDSGDDGHASHLPSARHTSAIIVQGPSSPADKQTPHPDGARPSSPVVQTPAADTPRAAKKSRPNASASERADMVDALKRSTDAIVSRKPKHECLVWAESIGMRMMVMPQQQRSLVRLRMEQAMFDIEFEFQATHQPLTPDGVSQCATEQYTTLTDVVGCLVPTQFCNN